MDADRINRDSEIGEATCSGTVKNISTNPLTNLEAECSNVTFGRTTTEKAKVKPETIAPNGTGTYKIKLGVIDGEQPVSLTLSADGKRVAYLNAYAAKRAESILALATKTFESTKLAYWNMSQGNESRTKVVKIYLRVDKALDGGTDEARQSAAASAAAAFAEYLETDKNLEGEPRLFLLRHEGFRLGWKFANGKLEQVD